MIAVADYTESLTQLIEGEEIMSPSPISQHQLLVGDLYDEIRAFLKKSQAGTVLMAPLDVILEEDMNRLQPDLFVVKKEHESIIGKWVHGVPDLVIEVVSPSSFQLDTVVKKGIYERYAVPELWLVFPEYRGIQVYVYESDKGHFRQAEELMSEDGVKSAVLPGLEVKYGTIFPPLPPEGKA